MISAMTMMLVCVDLLVLAEEPKLIPNPTLTNVSTTALDPAPTPAQATSTTLLHRIVSIVK